MSETKKRGRPSLGNLTPLEKASHVIKNTKDLKPKRKYKKQNEFDK